jgi:ATP/maltotriose-dependent transcriptional regulator MalT
MDLLERVSQISVLQDCLTEVIAGTGRVVLVSGEAGIGKTTLIEEFTNPHRKDFRVLWGLCDSLFTPRPLGPLYDITAQMGGNLQEMLLANMERTSLFSAVLKDLQSQPTIIVFEDIHWADEGTLDLLRFIGRRIGQTSALLVITYRDDALTPEHPLRIALGDLIASSLTRRILLPPLSQQAVRTLIGNREVDASDLYHQTAGNPFFVTEVLASPSGGIPSTVRDAVLARTASLSPAGRDILYAAAVIGPRIELWLLEKIAVPDPKTLEECMATGILIPQENALVFRHELSRQTILDAMSPQRRHNLHKLMLDALTSLPEAEQNLARIAHHAEAIGDRTAVLKYAPAAAQQASSHWAHREAASLYRLALRFADLLPAAEHARMLEMYARECNLTERQQEGIASLRKALNLWVDLGDTRKQGETLAFLAIILRNHGNNQEAEQANREAIDLLEPLPPGREQALAYRVQAILHLANRDIDEALDWGKRAIDLAEQFEAVNIQATAHVAIGAALLFNDFDRGCVYLEKQLQFGRKAWHERYIANLFVYLGSCCVELYQLNRAEVFLSEGIAFTSERGMDIFHRYMVAWMALALIHLGRWEDANDLLIHSIQRPAGSVFSRIPTLVASGLLRARRGDPGVDASLDEALELAEKTGTLPHLGLVRAARAEAAWLKNNPQRTFEEANAVYSLAVNKRHPWFTGELAFWGWRAGADFSPPDWTARPFALQIAGNWQAAAHAWEQMGCPYERAGALADGDTAAKITALEIYEHLGAQPAAERLRVMLRKAGVKNLPQKPHSSTRDNPFGLTSRQLEILSQLVEGLTNAEIAAALHISPKTVDHHVSAVLAKLDVRNREEAAETARLNLNFPKK